MGSYLTLLAVLLLTGTVLLGSAALLHLVLKLAAAVSSRLLRALVGLPAFAVLAAAVLGHALGPFSLEPVREFVNSGPVPLLWWGLCLGATTIPTMVFMHRHYPIHPGDGSQLSS